MSEECRTCRWRKERHRKGHHFLWDRVIHLCTHPDHRTILGVDWNPPPDQDAPRRADLRTCEHWQKPVRGTKAPT